MKPIQSGTRNVDPSIEQTGAPIKGVKVAATSPTQIGGTKVAYSNDEGGFRIPQLFPGTFEVRATAPKLKTVIQKEIENTTADKTIPNSEKKLLLEEFNQALKSAESIQFPSNIEVVQKYYDKIDVTTVAAYDGDRLSTSAVVRTISE